MNGNRAFPYQAIEKIPRKLVLVLAVALKPDQLLPVSVAAWWLLLTGHRIHVTKDISLASIR